MGLKTVNIVPEFLPTFSSKKDLVAVSNFKKLDRLSSAFDFSNFVAFTRFCGSLLVNADEQTV